jgi:sulfhydrogenase subunit delta
MNIIMDTPPKLVVGWFSFTCSEDSTILLTEMLNDHFAEWKKLVEFRYFKAIKSRNRLDNLDVAFVEGAISSAKQAADLKNIRNHAKYLVAIGACACTGQPSSGRNALVPEEINYKISYYLKNFDYSQNVQKIADFVKVDDQVNGCPMDPKKFLEILDKHLKIFNIN